MKHCPLVGNWSKQAHKHRSPVTWNPLEILEIYHAYDIKKNQNETSMQIIKLLNKRAEKIIDHLKPGGIKIWGKILSWFEIPLIFWILKLQLYFWSFCLCDSILQQLENSFKRQRSCKNSPLHFSPCFSCQTSNSNVEAMYTAILIQHLHKEPELAFYFTAITFIIKSFVLLPNQIPVHQVLATYLVLHIVEKPISQCNYLKGMKYW